VEDRRISICHVSEGGAWAGAEVQVATLLRALSKCPEIDLHAIVLHEGRLAQELRSFGVAVQVVSEQHKSFPQIISECLAVVQPGIFSFTLPQLQGKSHRTIALLHLQRTAFVRTAHGHPEPYSVVATRSTGAPDCRSSSSEVHRGSNRQREF